MSLFAGTIVSILQQGKQNNNIKRLEIYVFFVEDWGNKVVTYRTRKKNYHVANITLIRIILISVVT